MEVVMSFFIVSVLLFLIEIIGTFISHHERLRGSGRTLSTNNRDIKNRNTINNNHIYGNNINRTNINETVLIEPSIIGNHML
jgi:hypothetical protein